MSSAQGLMIISIVGDGSGIRVVKSKLFPALGHALLSSASRSAGSTALPALSGQMPLAHHRTASPCYPILICCPWGKSPALVCTDLCLVLYRLELSGSFCSVPVHPGPQEQSTCAELPRCPVPTSTRNPRDPPGQRDQRHPQPAHSTGVTAPGTHST